jgi:hypothetical protein
MFHELGSHFSWKQPPYEYEYHKMPVDLINGTDALRLWVEKRGSEDEYQEIMKKNQETFLEQRKSILIY